MANLVFREISEPVREHPSWEEMWKGPDQGLVHCWELGRKRAKEETQLADCAKKGELPSLGWKGGVVGAVKFKYKYGCLKYLAEWQGLRGENLDIDLDAETKIQCARTGVNVTFTADSSKWSLPGR